MYCQQVQSGCYLLLTWSNQHVINTLDSDILWKKTQMIQLPLKEIMTQGWKANIPRGKTAKVDCWSGQLEVNCL